MSNSGNSKPYHLRLIETDRTLIQDVNAARWLRFRNDWLPNYVSTAEYAQVKDLNLDMLLSLYPQVYAYGPRAAEVERVTVKAVELYASDPDETVQKTFYKAMVNLYAYAWEEIRDADELSALQDVAEEIGMEWALFAESGNTHAAAMSFSPTVLHHKGGGYMGAFPAEIFLQFVAVDGLFDLDSLQKHPLGEERLIQGKWVWIGGPREGEMLDVTKKLFEKHHDFLRTWGLL